MPDIRLNPNKRWFVDGESDYKGNIIETYGLNFNRIVLSKDSHRGDISSGNKLTRHTTATMLAGLGTPQAFIISDAESAGTAKYWMVDNTKVYSAETITNTFVVNNLANSPTVGSADLVVFGETSGSDRLIVSTNTDLWLLTGGTWTPNYWTSTLTQSAMASGVHPLGVLTNPFLLIVAEDNKVHTVDQNNLVSKDRLILPARYKTDWVKTSEAKVYLGVRDLSFAGPDGVWEYDPVNETAFFYDYNTTRGNAGAGVILQNNLIVFSPDGIIKQFNGRGFTDIKKTIFHKKTASLSPIIHRNGAWTNKNEIYFLMPAAVGQAIGAAGGVYVYDLNDGNFYHRYAINMDSDAGQPAINVGALWGDGQRLFAGASGGPENSAGVYVDSAATSPALTQSHRNYFITPKIRSDSVQSIWSKLWTLYRLYDESIVLKFRTEELKNGNSNGGTITATWTSTTTFTASSSGILEGYEIRILRGTNAGFTAHVTEVDGNTFTIDEAIGLGSGNSTIEAMNWTKIGSLTNSAVQYKDSSLPSTPSEWIQLKVELRSDTISIKDLILEYSDKITIK